MNKEDVLKLSRESNKDEGIENVEQRGRKLAFQVCSCVFVFEVILNMLANKQSYDICTLFFTYAAIEGMVQYRFFKKKLSFISMITCIIVAITCLVSFILTVMR